jgi:hypothetical protein
MRWLIVRLDAMAYCDGLLCGWRAGEGVQFGEQVRDLGRADLPEYLQCLPEQDLGLRGVPGG